MDIPKYNLLGLQAVTHMYVFQAEQLVLGCALPWERLVSSALSIPQLLAILCVGLRPCPL